MTKWLDVARKYEGVAEVAGAKSNPVILGWLQNEGKGKSWVKGDDTPWCGAFQAGVFTESGLISVVPPEPLRARSWEHAGVPLDGPKIGCIAVIPRGKNPAQGHVALVAGFDAEHLDLLGGNQGNKVSVARFKRPANAVYRWPLPLKTPAEIEAEGSRIAKAAKRQQRDAATTTAVGSSPQVAVPAPDMDVRGTIDGVVGDVGWIKTTLNTLGDFASFAGAKWPIIALVVAAYFGARIFWDGWQIRKFRTEDENHGWMT